MKRPFRTDTRSEYAIEWEQVAYMVLGVLLISPLGYGLPLLASNTIGLSLSAVLLLVLLGSSIAGAGFIAGTLTRNAVSAGLHLFSGCLAPLIGFFLISIGHIGLDNICETSSWGCDATASWALIGLVWGGIVFSWLLGSSLINQKAA